MSLGAIITVVLVVWAIVSGVVGAAAKRKEQERLAELAQRRRAQAQQMAAQTGEQPATPAAVRGSAKEASAHQVRVEELRRRREQQLAELRQQGRRGQPPTQARIGPARIAPRSAAPPTATPTRVQPPSTFRPATSARRVPTAAPRRVPPPRQPSRVRTGVTRLADHAERAGSLVLPTIEIPTIPDALGSRPSRRARVKLGGRSSLRRAIILKEILDRPVALRSEAVGEMPS